MPSFYILNNAPVVEATSAKLAAETYAREQNVTAGVVLVSGAVKSFDISATPADISAVEK